jgi:hypothetical protein
MSDARDLMRQIQAEDDYDRQPKCIQAIYTREQWKWTLRPEKDKLIATICQPDVEP